MVGRHDTIAALAGHRPFARIALIVLGSALIAAAAQVSVLLPVSPVPVTAQTLAVLLVAGALGPRDGVACVVLYLMEGALGLPVFAPGGAPGLARFAGPSAGYLVGFIAAALIVGWLATRGWDRRFVTAAIAMLLGSAAIDVFGLLWLGRFVAADRLLSTGLLPFVAGDIFKSLLAASGLPLCWAAARQVSGKDLP